MGVEKEAVLVHADRRFQQKKSTRRQENKKSLSESLCAGLFAGVLFAFLAISGCQKSGPERVQVYPVKGKITRDGKPLANALVAFFPKKDVDPKAISANASTNENGEFQVTTYERNDGLPSGTFSVTVQCYQLKKDGNASEPGPNILPEKYSYVESTPLEITVTKGENVLEPLDVTK